VEGKEEVAAFVKKVARQGVKWKRNSVDKKHKSDSDNEDVGPNVNDIELQVFNCEDMESNDRHQQSQRGQGRRHLSLKGLVWNWKENEFDLDF